MRRRLLLIYRDPEFDERGEVVLGQCEPFTNNWKLEMVVQQDKREVLLTGVYTDLRKIQESCAALDDPDAVRKRVRDMRVLLSSAVTETVAVEMRPEARLTETTRLYLPLPTQAEKEALMPSETGGVLEYRREKDALVARVTDPERVCDVALLNQQLRQLLEMKPRVIVLDLGRVQNLASRAANELVLFHDHCGSQRISFAVCGVRKSVQALVESLGLAARLPSYADCESALQAVSGALGTPETGAGGSR